MLHRLEYDKSNQYNQICKIWRKAQNVQSFYHIDNTVCYI